MRLHRSRADAGLVALVYTQASGDSGPINAMMARLQQFADAQGLPTRAIHAQDPTNYENMLRALGDAGAAIVLGTFPVISDAFKAVAPPYPHTRWIQLFSRPGRTADSESCDRLLRLLSRLLPVRHLRRPRLAVQSDRLHRRHVSLPPLNAGFNALKAGVHAVKPQATVTAAFAGSFQDPVKGYEIASQMFLGGIDYIQTDSAATDRGIIQAANEKPGRMVSALDPAQYLLGPASVVAVVSPDFGQSLHRQAGAALAFDWQGGRHVQTGLGTGVIDFLLSPVYQEQGSMEIVARSAETWPHIETARAGIFNGSVVVPFNPTI